MCRGESRLCSEGVSEGAVSGEMFSRGIDGIDKDATCDGKSFLRCGGVFEAG